MNRKALFVTLSLIAAIAATGLVALAGNLNPPAGPVAPTMKTLAEVEPRTVINATNTPGDAASLFKITQPGSYYLTGNINGVTGKNGIEINTGFVTLDLMGFQLLGANGSLDGVKVNHPGARNIVIRNGSLRQWGSDGLEATTDVQNARFEQLSTNDNRDRGIATSSNSLITNCVAQGNWGAGISAGGGCTVIGCTSAFNGYVIIGDGIFADSGSTVADCTAAQNNVNGINVATGCTVSRCTARANNADGIRAATGSEVSNCSSSSNVAAGIAVTNYCHVTGNVTAGNNAGVRTSGPQNRIDSNHSSANVKGYDVQSTGNRVIRNSANANGTDYTVAVGNDVGPIGAAATATSPWANLGSVPAPTCSDGIKNGNETGIDCGGGTCPTCPNGQGCLAGSDCQSGVCQAGICQAPTCSDGVKNGNETGVDCGGGTCPPCPNGQGCGVAADCQSGNCVGGICQP